MVYFPASRINYLAQKIFTEFTISTSTEHIAPQFLEKCVYMHRYQPIIN